MTANPSERVSVFREKEGADLRSFSLVRRPDGIEATLRLPGSAGVTFRRADLVFLRRALAAMPDLVPAPPPQPASAAPPDRMGQRWSAAEDGMLRQFLSDGVPIAAIGQSLRRSPAAIISRMYHLGLIAVVPVAHPGDPP